MPGSGTSTGGSSGSSMSQSGSISGSHGGSVGGMTGGFTGGGNIPGVMNVSGYENGTKGGNGSDSGLRLVGIPGVSGTRPVGPGATGL